MLQIKTIRNRLDNAEIFDREVNAALVEGWRLTKRDVLQPKAQNESVQSHTMLYAEMERVIFTEAERCCENCKHYDLDATLEPCVLCDDNADKWEAAEL